MTTKALLRRRVEALEAELRTARAEGRRAAKTAVALGDKLDLRNIEMASCRSECARHAQVKEADLVRLRVERDALAASAASERARRVAAERFLTPQQLHDLQTGIVTPLTVSAPPPVEPSLRTAAPGGGVPIGGDAA